METLAIAKQLHKVGIDEDDSYKIAEAINGRSGLATKEDIHVLKEDLHVYVRDEIQPIKEDIAELKADISEVKTEIAEIKTSQNWIKALGVAIIIFLLKIAFFPSTPPSTQTPSPTPTTTQTQPQ